MNHLKPENLSTLKTDNPAIAAQLHAVKDEFRSDLPKTLKHIADIGYSHIEFAGYYDHSLSEIKTALTQYNLSVAGNHASLQSLRDNPEAEINFLLELGCKEVVCPMASMETLDDVKKLSEEFNNIGLRCSELGSRFSYHNHAHEFISVDGVCLMDLLLESTDKNLVYFQPDVYWVSVGGCDPVDYLTKYKDRIATVHLKERLSYSETTGAAVGKGVLDFTSIMSLTNGKTWIIEQESQYDDVWDALAFGYQYIKKLSGNINKI